MSSSRHKTKNLVQHRQMLFREKSLREIEGSYISITATAVEEPLDSSCNSSFKYSSKEIEDAFHKAMNDFSSTELTVASEEFAEG